jgi:hypothetical protein
VEDKRTEMQKTVDLFFELTGRNVTPGEYKICVCQVKQLLGAGFKMDDIRYGIQYCAEHPPIKGFKSIGLLSYKLNDIMIDKKGKELQQEANNMLHVQEQQQTAQDAESSNYEKYQRTIGRKR